MCIVKRLVLRITQISAIKMFSYFTNLRREKLNAQLVERGALGRQGEAVWVRRPSSLSSSPQTAQLLASSGERCPQSSDSESSELPRACTGPCVL